MKQCYKSLCYEGIIFGGGKESGKKGKHFVLFPLDLLEEKEFLSDCMWKNIKDKSFLGYLCIGLMDCRF